MIGNKGEKGVKYDFRFLVWVVVWRWKVFFEKGKIGGELNLEENVVSCGYMGLRYWGIFWGDI